MTRDSIVSATEVYVNIEGNKIMPTYAAHFFQIGN